MTGFVQDPKFGPTTLSEIARVQSAISANNHFGCYAYATQSGFRVFELTMGKNFWRDTDSRWLFGIDYGRSDPRALKEIAKQDNTNVRVFDGEFVVDSAGFMPRRDYHPKLALMKNTSSGLQGLVVGSGNFSYNGLQRSVEAGAAFMATTKLEKDEHIEAVSSVFKGLWKKACPLDDIIEKYEAQLADLTASKDEKKPQTATGAAKDFWIEAGYVTKNRGQGKPGNQIFAPNGFRNFFGLKKAKSGSTLIGEITFETKLGPAITKNYRENDNGMEKLTLPMPEDHGFGVYDGKILVFKPQGGSFVLNAIELSEFEFVHGHRVSNVEKMTGGRRYGELT